MIYEENNKPAATGNRSSEVRSQSAMNKQQHICVCCNLYMDLDLDLDLTEGLQEKQELYFHAQQRL